MALPLVRGVTAASADSDNVVAPASTAIDDLVIVFHIENKGTDPAHTIASGYTSIGTVAVDSGTGVGWIRVSAGAKLATVAGAQTYQAFTGMVAQRGAGCVVLQTGTFDPTFLDAVATASAASAAPPDPPAITTTVTDALVFAVGGWLFGSALANAVTPPADFTERWEIASARVVDLAVATKDQASTGSVDPAAFGDDQTPLATAAITFAIKSLNEPPNAPTLGTVAPFDATAAATLPWTFDDPSAGASQSAYQLLIYRVSDGVTMLDTGKVVSAVEAYTLTAATLANEVNYQWKVRTWDELDAAGPYSALSAFSTSAKPVVTITVPAADASVIGAFSTTVQWSVNEAQSAYRVVVKNDVDVEQSSTGKVVSTSARAYEISGLPNGAVGWSVEITAWDAADIPSVVAVRTFDVTYTSPPFPVVTVTPQDAAGYLSVAIDNPAPDVGEPDVASNDLYRREQGTATWTRIVVGLAEDGSYLDYGVASGQVYEYKARANGDDSTFSESEVTPGTLTLLGIWLHDPDDPATTAGQFRGNKKRESKRNTEKAFHKFAGRELPVGEHGEHVDTGVGVTLHLYDDASRRALLALIERDTTLCYRDSRGRRHFGLIDNPVENDEKFGTSATFDFVACDHSESL